MISLLLLTLVVAWITFLARYPWLFASRRKQQSLSPHYHYDVCGSDSLPTWRRKSPGPTPKRDRDAVP
jgi:hypothetical protein